MSSKRRLSDVPKPLEEARVKKLTHGFNEAMVELLRQNILSSQGREKLAAYYEASKLGANDLRNDDFPTSCLSHVGGSDETCLINYLGYWLGIFRKLRIRWEAGREMPQGMWEKLEPAIKITFHVAQHGLRGLGQDEDALGYTTPSFRKVNR